MMIPSYRIQCNIVFLATNSFQKFHLKNKCSYIFLNFIKNRNANNKLLSTSIHSQNGFPFCNTISARSYSRETQVDITNRQLIASKKQIMAAKTTNSTATSPIKQNYDFFLVLDFEATCDKNAQPNPQEIIEFPVLKVNSSTMRIDSIFHKYVMPQFHPKLSTFCTELTGIIQSMVDDQPQFPEVLQSFHQWMESEGLLNPNTKSIFVTCGDWDLKTMLPKQCAVLDIAVKPYFRQWVNIKKSFADVTSTYPKGMMVMLNNLNLKHVGRQHSGIDDCKNIANVLITLMQRGYILKQNNGF